MKYMLYLRDEFDNIKSNIMKPILSDGVILKYIQLKTHMPNHPITYCMNPNVIIPTNKIKYHKQFIEQKEILKCLHPHQYLETNEVKLYD